MTKSWMDDAAGFEVHDARESDPGSFFPLITGLGDALAAGDGLRVIQSFDPIPLYAVMEAKGLEHETQVVADDEFHVYFFRPASDGASMSEEMRSHLQVEPERVIAIEAIVKDFYDGIEPADLKVRFDQEVGSISGTEFAFIEQKMSERGIGDDEFEEHVEGLLDIFRNALDREDDASHEPGHPLDTMAKENVAILALAEEIRQRAEGADPDSMDPKWWGDALSRLWQVDLHYVRKENEIFPRLEQKGFDKPSTVMWSLHDKIRDGLKAVRGSLAEGNYQAMLDQLAPALEELVGMTYKEAKILFPTCDAMMTVEEFAEVRRGDDEIGYCLIEEPPPWPPVNVGQSSAKVEQPETKGIVQGETDVTSEGTALLAKATAPEAKPFVASGQAPSRVGAISLANGVLTPRQVSLVLQHLPSEIVFVDECDEVVYSDVRPGEGISSASPETVAQFKAGSISSSGQWVVGGSSVWVQSVAVRDENGDYQGYLQTRQTLTGAELS